VGAHRRRDRPGILLKSTRVNPLGTPGTSSGQVRPPPAMNSGRRCGQSAQGLHCSDFVLSRGWNAKPKDLFVRNEFSDLGCPG
jgi:hypothetical protein